MSKRSDFFTGLLKWGVRLVVLLLVIFALQVTVLAFPQILIRNSVTAGTVRLYYNGEVDEEMSRLAGEADMRLQVSEYYDSSQIYRVFYCGNSGLYSLFARLSMVTTMSQGFELSVFENSFINGSRIDAMRKETGGFPKYGIFEGDPAHTIAHEIWHQYMIDLTGRGVWKSLPHWKQEGFPEYTANIAAIRADSSAALIKRISILNNDQIWGGKGDWSRIHYEAGLLFEYLFDIRNFTLDDIIADSVTKEKTLEEMMEWYKEQTNEYP